MKSYVINYDKYAHNLKLNNLLSTYNVSTLIRSCNLLDSCNLCWTLVRYKKSHLGKYLILSPSSYCDFYATEVLVSIAKKGNL